MNQTEMKASNKYSNVKAETQNKSAQSVNPRKSVIQTKGYKPSPLGPIPNDWDASCLGALAKVTSGGTPDRKQQSYWNGNIPWVTTSLIDFNVINDAEEFITQEGLKNSAAKLFPAGTLLMALYGQGITRGK